MNIHIMVSLVYASYTYLFKNLAKIAGSAFFLLFFCADASSQVSGNIFRDFNADGLRQAEEPLQSGVQVFAYNSSGALCGSTVSSGDSEPNYTIHTCSGPVRIEFVVPDLDCQLNSQLDFSGYKGNIYGSSVQFATVPASGINFAVMYPGDYEPSDNPEVLIPCYVNGNPLGGSASGEIPWFVSFPYTNSGNDMPTHKIGGQIIGSTWGVAYSRQAKKIFTSAFLKRHSGLGTLGSGGIYMIDYSGSLMGTVTEFYDMDAHGYRTRSAADCGLAYGNGQSYTITGQAVTFNGPVDPASGLPCGLGMIGSNVQRGLPDDPLSPSTDPAAFDQVGKVSLGGLEISDDGRYLYVINLYDRRLYRLELNNAGNPTAVVSVQSWAIPSQACEDGILRPWGLKYYRGKLYVGAVCSGENGGTNDTNDDGITDLQSYVFVFDAQSNSFEAPSTLNIPLDYLKGRLRPTMPAGISGNKWQPWTHDFNARLHLPGQTFACYPTPVLTDIEFSAEGNMVLSYTDRAGHQYGADNYNLTASQVGLSIISGGDILMVERNDCSWSREDNAQTANLTGCGIDNDQGHGGGEFFCADAHPEHEETVQGGLVGLRKIDQVLSTVIAPIQASTGGTKRFSTIDGTLIPNSPYTMYGLNPNFGKANGLGDMEFKFLPIPLEVGNRVWLDANENGVQDAGETPLPNIPMQLLLNNVVVGQTTTDANGTYYFNETNVVLNGAAGLLPFTHYQVRILGPDFPSGYNLTLTNVGGAGQADVRDNDSQLSGGHAVINFTTRANGDNDHTLDFGFINCPQITSIDTTFTPSNCLQPDGFASVTVTGNAPGYAYRWENEAGEVISTTNSAANLVPGIYIVYITSVGAVCTSLDSVIFEIGSISGPEVEIDEIQPAVCAQATGSVTLTVSGGTPPYTYLWSTGSTAAFIEDLPAGNYSVTVTDDAGCESVRLAIVPGALLPLEISLVAIDSVDCFSLSGGIDISVAGGSPDYTYLWSNGSTSQDLSGVEAGSYSVTVTDEEGCTDTASFILAIEGPADDCCPVIEILGTVAGTTPCGAEEGIATVTLSGSATGYIFRWEDAEGNVVSTDSIASDLAAGTYTVYIRSDMAGCGEIDTFVIITALPGPEVSIGEVTNSICSAENGSVTISVTGGTPEYTYLWSNGSDNPDLTDVPAGTYTVTVTDQNGCSDTASATVSADPGDLTAEATATPSDCNEATGTAQVIVDGAEGDIDILWSNGATTAEISGLAAGVYSVIVRDEAGCEAVDTVTVSNPDAPALSAVADSVDCFGEASGSISITVGLGVSATVYNSLDEEVGSAPLADDLPAGIYEVIAVNTAGCESSVVVEIYQPNAPLLISIVSVNPSDCEDTKGAIAVSVSGGTLPYTYLWSNGATTEDLLNVEAGSYSLTVTDARGCTQTTTIAVQQITGCCPDIVDVLAVPAQELCNGIMTEPVIFSSTNPGVQFTWSNPDPSIGLPAVGFGDIPAFMAINNTQSTKVIQIEVTPFYVGTAETCFGTAIEYQLSINPTPSLAVSNDLVICEGGSANLSAIGSVDCEWTPAQYLDDPNSCTPVATPPVSTVYTLHATNADGCTAIEHVIVSIHDPGAMACNNLVQVSLDHNGEALILPDMILEGLDDDLEVYGVMITTMDGTPVPNPVTCAYTGQTLIVKVFDLCGSNSCWGKILVEDKIAPVLECGELEAVCGDSLVPGASGMPFPSGLILGLNVFPVPGQPGYYTTPLLDNCGPVSLHYQDQIINTECSGPYWATYLRLWTASDPSGNVATCTQTIRLLRADIDDLVGPGNYDGTDHPMLVCLGSWDLNGNNYPDPEETGTLSGLACNLEANYTDVLISSCAGSYKIIRRWTVLDWCTAEVTTITQIIKVVDNTPPTVQCPANVTISTNIQDCKASYIFPPAVVSDACSEPVTVVISGPGFVLAQNGGLVSGIAPGNHTVTYTATDDCGNSASCTFTLTVRDGTAPQAVCDQHTTVALLQDGRAKAFAYTFDDGSYDNCAIDSFAVRRMSPVPACGIDSKFRNYVEFCCEDVGASPVQVVFRVYDKSGNFNECMVLVTVQDKTPPVIACPPNITIDCDYPFDIWDLSAFGTVRKLESERRNIWIKTKRLVNLPNGNCEYRYLDSVLVGRDGIAYDNCSLDITVTESVNIDNCGEGQILRQFRATDKGGLTTSCTQVITLLNLDPFNGEDAVVGWDNYQPEKDLNQDCRHDIYWPLDYEATTCGQALEPENLPDGYNQPRIIEDACDLVGIGHDDWYFEIQGEACAKIIRRWKVIDWCRQNPQTGEYYFWMYEQIIKIKNTIAPVFDTCQDLTICTYDPDCSPVSISLKQSAIDDCTPADKLRWTYKIDLWNDGIYDIANGKSNDASGTYPINVPDVTQAGAYHRVLWTVEDGCGNKATCEKRFRIVDCKVPSPVCYHGLAADLMPVDTDGDGSPDAGMVTVWASDFNASSYDFCTPAQQLKFSFSADTSDKGKTFDCDDLGSNLVQMWVTDAYGNQDFCETYILIQDNNQACQDDTTTKAKVAGSIHTENEKGVASVEVQLMKGTAPAVSILTQDNGHYVLSADMEQSYELRASRNDNPMNGVSTQDLVLIQKYILNQGGLQSIYQLIAADINHSNSVTAADLVELRKLILGRIDHFSNNTSWRMVVPNGATTLAEVQETRLIDPLHGDLSGQDFMAVKIGDVSGNAKANSQPETEARSGKSWSMRLDETVLSAGQVCRVDFRASDLEAFSGCQFVLRFDPAALRFVQGTAARLNIGEENFGLQKLDQGLIAMSWNGVEPIGLSANEVLFSLLFEAKTAGQISDLVSLSADGLRAEAYDALGNVIDLRLEFPGEASAYELFQNTPNPFDKQTQVAFKLPRAMKAKLSVYDVSGKMLQVVEADFAKGYNQVELDARELGVSGVLYYKLETSDYTASKRMVLIR